MVIASDLILKGERWKKASEDYSVFFKQRTHYDIFLISASIGVVYDEQEEAIDDGTDLEISIPRNVFNNRSEPFDKLVQTALLSSSIIDMTDEERLKLAFSDENDDFDRLEFLVKFANFGINKLNDLKGIDDIETMENLKDFIIGTVEGTNYEIEEINKEAIAETIIGYNFF